MLISESMKRESTEITRNQKRQQLFQIEAKIY